jgi:hypothetical protein
MSDYYLLNRDSAPWSYVFFSGVIFYKDIIEVYRDFTDISVIKHSLKC